MCKEENCNQCLCRPENLRSRPLQDYKTVTKNYYGSELRSIKIIVSTSAPKFCCDRWNGRVLPMSITVEFFAFETPAVTYH